MSVSMVIVYLILVRIQLVIGVASAPTDPTSIPSEQPTRSPSLEPTIAPTKGPSSGQPTQSPTKQPSLGPSILVPSSPFESREIVADEITTTTTIKASGFEDVVVSKGGASDTTLIIALFCVGFSVVLLIYCLIGKKSALKKEQIVNETQTIAASHDMETCNALDNADIVVSPSQPNDAHSAAPLNLADVRCDEASRIDSSHDVHHETIGLDKSDGNNADVQTETKTGNKSPGLETAGSDDGNDTPKRSDGDGLRTNEGEELRTIEGEDLRTVGGGHDV